MQGNGEMALVKIKVTNHLSDGKRKALRNKKNFFLNFEYVNVALHISD